MNATNNGEIDLAFVERFRKSIYVENFTAGSYDVESAFEFHLKSIGYTWLKPALTLHEKFDTNSPELHQRISEWANVGLRKRQGIPYAAVVYLQDESETGISTQFLCSKTRVAPVKKITIPRLTTVSTASLSTQLEVLRSMGSNLETQFVHQLALCRISEMDQKWKQFVQNRVLEIR